MLLSGSLALFLVDAIIVAIHEPVRLLFVVETTAEAMQKIIKRDETIGRPIRNGWVHLAVLDPGTNRLQLYQAGRFRDYRPQSRRLPRAPTSAPMIRPPLLA